MILGVTVNIQISLILVTPYTTRDEGDVLPEVRKSCFHLYKEAKCFRSAGGLVCYL